MNDIKKEDLNDDEEYNDEENGMLSKSLNDNNNNNNNNDNNERKISTISNEEIFLAWDDINYIVTLPSGKKKKILRRVSGFAKSGEVLCIMGGSGAGKTCLMNCLAQRGLHGKIEGSLTLNGQTMIGRYKNSAFVMADDDSLYPTLTVYESLLFSANLRLTHLSSKEIKNVVLETLNELDILNIKDSLIGNIGSGGISTGQRRRVAIGVELVAGKSLLYLDEPTSGLDSTTALNVVNIMEKLARKGRCIITVLHQPRAKIYQRLDRILLLSPRGSMVYFGLSSEAEKYFQNLGYTIPQLETISDFMLDITKEMTSETLTETYNLSKKVIIDEIEKIFPDRGIQFSVDNDNSLISKQLSLTSTFENDNDLTSPFLNDTKSINNNNNNNNNVSDNEKNNKGIMSFFFGADEDDEEAEANYFYQLYLCTKRAMINRWRDHALIFSIYLTAVFIGLLGYVFYPNMGYKYEDFQNRVALLTMLPYATSLFCTTGFEVQKRDRHVFQLERSNGYYHPTCFIFGICLADVLQLRILPPLISGAICYYPCNLVWGSTNFLIFLSVMVIMNVIGSGLCRVVGSIIKDNGTATLFSSALILLMLLYCGFLVNPDTIPDFLTWFQDASYFYWGCGILYWNEVENVMFDLGGGTINGTSYYYNFTGLNDDDYKLICRQNPGLCGNHTIDIIPLICLNDPEACDEKDVMVQGSYFLEALSLEKTPLLKGFSILGGMVGIYFTIAALIALFFHKAKR